MPKLSVTVPHELSQEEATTRLQGILAKMKDRYQGQFSDLQEDWVGNTLNYGFKTFGFNIKGVMQVEPGDVKVESDLPFAAMMFKGRIETELKSTLARWLGPKPTDVWSAA